MNLRPLFLSGAIFIVFASARGQKYFEKQNVVSTSPQAAAFEKYTDYPVSLYTGVPQVVVPVHVIKLKAMSIPISVSYHSSGIKVDDVASNVGLGWSLNAGGAVSIQANGILDEFSGFGYQHAKYTTVKNLSLQTSYSSQSVDCSSILAAEDLIYLYAGGDIQFLRDVNFSLDDSEPDLYSFSTPTKSGKFFMDENGVFQTVPFSKVKIERKYSGTNILGYEITDDDGTIYQFFWLEESQINSANNCGSAISTTSPYKGIGRTYNLT